MSNIFKIVMNSTVTNIRAELSLVPVMVMTLDPYRCGGGMSELVEGRGRRMVGWLLLLVCAQGSLLRKYCSRAEYRARAQSVH